MENKKLFQHLSEEHNLTLLETELMEIKNICVEETKTERDELFGLIESIHHLFESDKPITKDSVIGKSIEVAYKTFKD